MDGLDENKGDSTWKLSIISPEFFLPSLEEIIYATAGENFPSIAAFEIPGDSENKLMEVYFNVKPSLPKLEDAIANMAKIFEIVAPACSLKEMVDKDWVAESQKLLKPIEAGRFYLFGSHDAENVPDDKVAILMEAGQAFGTGSHETTNGCLLAIDDLAAKLEPRKILDLGCGSGVLAIAMSKVWRAKITASDIDPIATKTALENLLSNGVATVGINDDEPGVAAVTSNGFEDNRIASNGPFDLIAANILAEPLKQLAPDIVKNLEQGGQLILSGLLKEQDESVRAAYEALGMRVTATFPINEWQTLVVSCSD